ncbi:MAG: hypothetical protein KAH11_07875 [Rhodospirillales bacterium]|nr:hypothetical protein [Rhodospirillales bacterium]
MRIETRGQSKAQAEKTRSPYRANHRARALAYKEATEAARNTPAEESRIWSQVGDLLDQPVKPKKRRA